MKNILYIKNFSKGNNLNYLKDFSNVNLTCIKSIDLTNYDYDKLSKLIEIYDIIILGGGEQHLTSKNILQENPEIEIQIKLVKLLSSKYKSLDKLLIGLCLGCQIIALAYGHSILPMNKLIIGFNFLDINKIDNISIKKIEDKYLSKLNFNLLSKSFSFHYDYMNIDIINESYNSNNDYLQIIAKSIDNIPYIIKNNNSNIYGFQFHPEITSQSILNVLDIFLKNEISKFKCLKKSIDKKQLENIYMHFFDIFINN